MSWYYYDDSREARAKTKLKLTKAGKKPLEAPQGSRKIAKTFWGKAWCDHLESHADYAHRLPRGRSYLRQGSVYDLAIAPGMVTAQVSGTYIYDVRVPISPLTKAAWERIKSDCAGKVGSLLDLLAGRLGEDVLRTITDRDRGLFPAPREIKLICSCPDSANMCKHVAAVLYGVGMLLDASPELFFVLRSVDPAELLSGTAEKALAEVDGVDAALAGEDLSALFGIDLEAESAAVAEEPPPAKKPKPKKAPVKPKAGTEKKKAAVKREASAKKPSARAKPTPKR